MTPNAAGYAQTLLRHVLTNPSSLTNEQFTAAGVAARNLLAFAWQHEPRSSWLVTNSIRSVCTTFASDIQKSGELLRKALDYEQLSKYGYEEAPQIARFASEISVLDPALTAEIYSAIFNHDEESTDKTDMISSRILPMTSNRRQDYHHSKWELAQRFPRLLEASLFHAAQAMASVAASCAASERNSDSASRPATAFTVDGKKSGIIEDYSYIWDQGSHAGKENEMQIIDSFFRTFSERVQNPENDHETAPVLQFLMTAVRPGLLWRRLLQLGSAAPQTVGLKMKAVASAVPLLRAVDTEDSAEDFIAAVYPLLDEEDRGTIEHSILSLPVGAEPRLEDVLTTQRDRILFMLPKELIVTQSARDLRSELDVREVKPEERIPRQPMRVTSGVVDEAFFLEHVMGVSASSEPHKAILQMQAPVQKFAAQYSNSCPDRQAIDAALPDLRALKNIIDSPPSGTDDKVVSMACGTLADACGVVASSESLDCKSEAGIFAHAVLLELSSHPEPEHNPKYDSSFDEHPSWGSPLPRIEAADGVIKLARFETCFEEHISAAINRLLADSVPAVRFQIASRLTCLYNTARELMWQLIERVAIGEQSYGVLETLGHVLDDLRGVDPERVGSLCTKVLGRLGAGRGSDRCRETYVTVETSLFLWNGVSESRDFLLGLVDNPPMNARALSTILQNLRGAISLGSSNSEDQARPRALELFSKIVESTYAEYVRLIEISRSGGSNVADSDALQKVVGLIAEASNQLYFGSGVFDRQQSHTPEPPGEQQQAFYAAVAQIVDTLSATGLPGPTQHLVEMLEGLIAVDPRRVFLQISKMVESGRLWGYEFESMAMELIVRIVERYLADHRSLLQHDVECRVALRKLLDAFVEAGWPAAQQLSYRLDEIFR